MGILNRRLLVLGGVAVAASLKAPAVRAQASYPTKPVRLVSPWAPGGSADVTTRLVGDRLTGLLGQPFVVEARAGATGTIGFASVARAAPDGYTLLLGTNSTYGIAPHLLPSLPFTMADLAPVALVATNAQIICIHPSIPSNDLASFIAHVRANPGKLTYGSGGIGGTSHMASALLASTAELDMLHVPYRGSGLSQQALLGNEVQMVGLDIASARPFIEAGSVRALAVSSIQRSAAMPNVPTVAELGYPGFDSATVFALFAPAGTPPDILATLNRAINAMLAQPDTRARFVSLGLDGSGGTAEELARHITVESDKWRDLIARTGIRMD
jgi:tripartite-type tricarboxylate transporter receptor subunit TctC